MRSRSSVSPRSSKNRARGRTSIRRSVDFDIVNERGTCMNDELAKLDATAQAEMVRRGDAKPVELVQAAIDRIERLNPQLNAVIHKHYERALGEARRPPPAGPLPRAAVLLPELRAG